MKRLILLFLFAASAQAFQFTIGELDFTGNFTVNHLYNPNIPGNGPFGRFGPMTAIGSSGIFAPHVNIGDQLSMATEDMIAPTTWTIGGFTLQTYFVNATGADVSTFCLGQVNLSGNGFNPNAYPFPVGSGWDFIAPPFDVENFPADITGPINMKYIVAYEFVPDSGTTLVLLLLGIIALSAAAWPRAQGYAPANRSR